MNEQTFWGRIRPGELTPLEGETLESYMARTMQNPYLKGTPPNAADICNQAAGVIGEGGKSRTVHGDPMRVHARVARLWSAFLGIEIAPAEVATMMVLFKAARSVCGNYNRDDYIDMTGYAAIAGELKEREREEGSKI